MQDKLVEVIKKAALEEADYFGLVYQREGFFEYIAAAIREQMCCMEHVWTVKNGFDPYPHEWIECCDRCLKKREKK